MKPFVSILAIAVACPLWARPSSASAQTTTVPPALTTPDRVETRIGVLEFKDGAPTMETAEKVRDALDIRIKKTRSTDAHRIC